MIDAAQAKAVSTGARMNVRLPKETLDALAELARERGCSVADMVRAGLSEYVRYGGRSIARALFEETRAFKRDLSMRAELQEARGDRYGDPDAFEEARRLTTQERQIDRLIERMSDLTGFAPRKGD